MSNVFIAINGDDVGSRIGQAIANDDHKSLAQATSSIQNAHNSIDEWVSGIGGKKISSAGDDAIYMVPEQAVNDLDGIRASYKEQSGHGLTVGVGQSMSQASKALIYGKMNGKDQTIHYEPMIEDYLQDEDEDQPEVPGQDDLQDQADTDMETDSGSGALEDAPDVDSDVDDSQSAVPGAAAPQDPAAMMPQTSTKNPIDDNEQMDGDFDPAASMEDDSDEPEAGNEDDISDDSEAATDSPGEPVANQTPAQQANENPTANTPPIDGKTDVDFGTSDDDMMEDQDLPDGQSDDEDMPDTDEDTMGGDEASMDDLDGSSVHEDAGGEEGHDELSDDDVASPEDQDDGEDPLASMIHGDMQDSSEDVDGDGDVDGDDTLQDADMDGDGDLDGADAVESADQDHDGDIDGDDASVDEELKNDIATALMAFKENKDMLEQAREQNPPLYNATLTMLRSMIAMAKKLGFAPEQDMADQEANDSLDQGFPEAGDEDMSSDDIGADDESVEDIQPTDMDEEDAPPAKK